MSDVGEIIGRLRLDAGNWFEELSRAEAKARELSGVDPKVVVKTEGTARAVTELEAVAVAEDHIDASSKRSAKSMAGVTGEARRQADAMAYLIKTLVAVGPALVPVAAGAVGVTAAFGGMATAGVFAVLGIKREMETGTQTGLQYRAVFQGLTDDAHRLSSSAATGLLPGLTASSSVLQAAMPTLNRELSMFTGYLGQILPTGVDALVTGLAAAEPLLDASGRMLVNWVDALDDAAHSKGFQDFIGYAIANLPRLEQLLGTALQFAGDFLSQMAPYGDVVLDVVTGLLRTADALTPLAPLIWGVWTAFAAWRVVSGIVGGITSKLVVLGSTATASGEAVAASGVAAKAGGLAAAAGWTAALLALSQYAAFAAAKQNYEVLYAQTPGSAKTKQATAAQASRNAMTSPSSVGGGGMGIGFALQGDIDKGRRAQTGLAGATEEAAAAQRRSAAASQQMRFALDGATISANAARAAQNSLATTNQTLIGSWDSAVDAAQSVTDQIKVNEKAHVKDALSLDRDTAAGRQNREGVLAAVQAATAHATAMVKAGKSSNDAAVYTDRFAIKLRDSLVQMGMSRTAAQSYINKLLGIPKNVTTEAKLRKDEAEAKLAAYRREVEALDGYVATVYVGLRQTGLDPSQAGRIAKNPGTRNGAHGGTAGASDFGSVPRMAGGGTIIGPGTAGSDRAGTYRLANGEEVVSNLFGGAASLRPFLKAVSAGKVSNGQQAARYFGGAGGAQHADNSKHITLHVHGAPGQSEQGLAEATMRRLNQELRGA